MIVYYDAIKHLYNPICFEDIVCYCVLCKAGWSFEAEHRSLDCLAHPFGSNTYRWSARIYFLHSLKLPSTPHTNTLLHSQYSTTIPSTITAASSLCDTALEFIAYYWQPILIFAEYTTSSTSIPLSPSSVIVPSTQSRKNFLFTVAIQ